MIRSIAASLVAVLTALAVPAVAQNFPDKQAVLEKLRITTFNGMIVRRADPVQRTTTLTNTNSWRGGSTSTSQTFDSTARPARQVFRVGNPTIYDIKNLSMECVYFAESGTPIAKNTQTFLKVFWAGRIVEVRMETPRAPEADYVLCGPRDFEYIGIGHSAPPVAERPAQPGEPLVTDASGNTLQNEWGKR